MTLEGAFSSGQSGRPWTGGSIRVDWLLHTTTATGSLKITGQRLSTCVSWSRGCVQRSGAMSNCVLNRSGGSYKMVSLCQGVYQTVSLCQGVCIKLSTGHVKLYQLVSTEGASNYVNKGVVSNCKKQIWRFYRFMFKHVTLLAELSSQV